MVGKRRRLSTTRSSASSALESEDGHRIADFRDPDLTATRAATCGNDRTRGDQLCTREQFGFRLSVMIGREASPMKIKIGVVLAMVLVSFARINAKTSTLSGWVSDESCGA